MAWYLASFTFTRFESWTGD